MDFVDQLEEMRVGLHRKFDLQFAAIYRIEFERIQREGDVIEAIDAVGDAMVRGEARMVEALYRLRDRIAPVPALALYAEPQMQAIASSDGDLERAIRDVLADARAGRT